MRLRELTVIIANISAVAAMFRQAAASAQMVNGEKTVIVASDGVMEIAENLLEYCEKLRQLIPDIDIKIEGGE